jgi:23S rRNA-/tRNA-specific pseudouridylate synthase
MAQSDSGRPPRFWRQICGAQTGKLAAAAIRAASWPTSGMEDAELLRLLAAELRLDGGCSELSSLPTYNPRIRKLLGERKLWAFVREHPRYFDCLEQAAAAESGAGSTNKLTARLLEAPPAAAPSAAAAEPPGGWSHRCSGCDAGFGSRNALFKHLRKPGACPAATAAAAASAAGSAPTAALAGATAPTDPLAGISAAGKALVQSVQGALREQQQADPVPLPWVVSPAKSRSALRRFVRESGALAAAADRYSPVVGDSDNADDLERGSLEVFRPRWWLVAMQALHALLCGLPALFELSSSGGASELSSDELRSCTIKEAEQQAPQGDNTAAAAAAAAAAMEDDDARSAEAVAFRVVQLLEWQEVKSGRQRRSANDGDGKGAGSEGLGPAVTLGVLARDKGLQKHLGSRPLLPLLQAQCAQQLLTCDDDDDDVIGDDLTNADDTADVAPKGAASRVSRLRLVHEEARGWCAQLLLLPPADAATTTTAAAGSAGTATPGDARSSHAAADDDEEGGGGTWQQQSSARHVATSSSVTVLAVFPGAVAVDKPCGVSTEAVIDWLQHDPPEEVAEEIARQADDVELESEAQPEPEPEPQLDAVDRTGTDDDTALAALATETDTTTTTTTTTTPPRYRLESVSRLDKPTSGVLLVPLSRTALHALSEQWRSRSVEKTYLCLCSGALALPQPLPPRGAQNGATTTLGRFDAKLRTLSRGRGSKTAPHPQGKEALTEYRRLALYTGTSSSADDAAADAADAAADASGAAPTTATTAAGVGGGDTQRSDGTNPDATPQQFFSLCEVFPRTGRTHQIRAHFAAAGYPLVGDVKYGGPTFSACVKTAWMTSAAAGAETGGRGGSGDSSGGGDSSSRLFLHSARLRFTGVADSGGVQQQRHEVSAALPRELAELLEGLTKVEE